MSRLFASREEKEKAREILILLSGMNAEAAEVALGEAQSLISAIKGKTVIDLTAFDESSALSSK
jgi:hypothetical protein